MSSLPKWWYNILVYYAKAMEIEVCLFLIKNVFILLIALFIISEEYRIPGGSIKNQNKKKLFFKLQKFTFS